MAVAGSNIWVADNSSQGSNLSEFASASGDLLKIVSATKSSKWALFSPSSIAVAGSNIWVSDGLGTSALEFSAKTGAYLRQTRGGPPIAGIDDISYHNGYLWASSSDDSSVSEYNATTGNYIRSISPISGPGQLIFTGTDLFIISGTPESALKYSRVGSFIRTIAHFNNPSNVEGISAILFDGKDIWVANFSHSSVTRYPL